MLWCYAKLREDGLLVDIVDGGVLLNKKFTSVKEAEDYIRENDLRVTII